MDCIGYSALTAARLVVEARGGIMTWLGATGEPARLLDLVAVAHRQSPRSLIRHARHALHGGA